MGATKGVDDENVREEETPPEPREGDLKDGVKEGRRLLETLREYAEIKTAP